jgi:hypothetical protein
MIITQKSPSSQEKISPFGYNNHAREYADFLCTHRARGGAAHIDLMGLAGTERQMLPFVSIFMVPLIHKKELMEDCTNSKTFSRIARTTAAVMTAPTGGDVVALFLRKERQEHRDD